MVVAKDSKAIPFTTVKIFTKENHELIARTITNEKGVYFIVVNEGEYILEAQNNGLRCVKELSLEKYSEIKEQLILE